MSCLLSRACTESNPRNSCFLPCFNCHGPSTPEAKDAQPEHFGSSTSQKDWVRNWREGSQAQREILWGPRLATTTSEARAKYFATYGWGWPP